MIPNSSSTSSSVARPTLTPSTFSQTLHNALLELSPCPERCCSRSCLRSCCSRKCRPLRQTCWDESFSNSPRRLRIPDSLKTHNALRGRDGTSEQSSVTCPEEIGAQPLPCSVDVCWGVDPINAGHCLKEQCQCKFLIPCAQVFGM